MISISKSVYQYGEDEKVEDDDVQFPALPDLAGSGSGSDEWTYTMRRTMQEIVPGVYLGPYSSAMRAKLLSLRAHGITHIICVRHRIEAHYIRPNFPDDFRYLVLDVADSLTENIIQHFPLVRDFIEESLLNGGKTLVHGNAGISRSAAFVMAYIMEKYGLTLNLGNPHSSVLSKLLSDVQKGTRLDFKVSNLAFYFHQNSFPIAYAQALVLMKAFQVVQQRRFCINPNEGFMAQLSEFEPIYRAQRILRNGQSSTEITRNKRRLDCIEDCIGEEDR